MNTSEDQQGEEQAAMDEERSAFLRLQNAFFRVRKQFAPQGSGISDTTDLDELDAANAAWKAASAKVERIGYEIRTGKRW